MIHSLKRKLNSQRGASMLLALLFLLICVMVSASILMAAVSNTGKHRSNMEEHQTYLALSSAVSLICDELARTEYQGQYSYWETRQIIPSPDGGPGKTKILRHFAQLDGAYHQIDKPEQEGYLHGVLLSDLDALFAQEIRSRLNRGDFETFTTKADTGLPTHTLTLTPQTGTGLDEREIEIQLNVVKESCAIELTATLDDYQMRAELTPITNRPTLPVTLTEGKGQKTGALQWEIGWITTGEEEVEP